jgi:RNA polymerase sigma-70 factor (ECF subfamily)
MANNEVNWEAVYWEQLPRIYNFFRYRIGDNQVAQDLTATTFEKAWRARRQYSSNLGAFEAWLFGIARNVAIDHFRCSWHPQISLEDVDNLVSPQSIEQEVQHHLDVMELRRLLKNLPSREQGLVALKYGAGLTNRAIAKVTGLSESNVGTILHRVVNKLSTEWEITHA